MKYSRFEAIIVSVGFVAILSSVLLSLRPEPVIEEVLGQVLLLVVLVGAAHWGRNGGFITALAASGLYVIARIPAVAGSEGLTADLTSLIVVRILSYGLIGIVGGELCSRMKYILVRLEGAAGIDDWSQVYNQRFILRALESASGQHTRYGVRYSILLVSLAPRLFDGLRAEKQRTLVRAIGSHIRGDIRLVDEAGRLNDGRFLVVLPQTPREGALVAAERLRKGVCDIIGATEESVSVSVLTAPDDLEALAELKADLASGTPLPIQTSPSCS